MSQDRPSEEQIRSRAYEIYLKRGGQPGNETDDWLQAEYELIQLPTANVATLEPSLLKDPVHHPKTLVRIVRAALMLAVAAGSLTKR